MLCKATITVCLAFTTGAVAWAQTVPPEAKPSDASPPADMADSMVQPLPGDRWTYEIRDEITCDLKYTSTNIITDVTPTEISVRWENLGNPGTGHFVYDHSWNLKIGPIWKYSPSDGTGIRQ